MPAGKVYHSSRISFSFGLYYDTLLKKNEKHITFPRAKKTLSSHRLVPHIYVFLAVEAIGSRTESAARRHIFAD